MKTYYYLADVANGTSPVVRELTAAERPSEAFAQAAINLGNRGFIVTAMQELQADQYFADNMPPVSYNTELKTTADVRFFERRKMTYCISCAKHRGIFEKLKRQSIERSKRDFR